jgi:hypothetical protein
VELYEAERKRNEGATRFQVDPEKTNVTLRLGFVASVVGFIIYATFTVSGFMSQVRTFQDRTTEAFAENKSEIRKVADKVEVLTARQNNVMGDRWRYSDQLPWTYKLEQANRDLLRDDGGKGLVVPEPIAKPSQNQ